MLSVCLRMEREGNLPLASSGRGLGGGEAVWEGSQIRALIGPGSWRSPAGLRALNLEPQSLGFESWLHLSAP